MKTKAETARWSLRYQLALRRHLNKGAEESLLPALRLGRQAVLCGLETLDLALIHEQALKSIVPPDVSARAQRNMVEQAKKFFAETIVPIEKTHGAALLASFRVNQLTKALQLRTAESSVSTRQLKRSIVKRQSAEAALVKSVKDHASLLKKSDDLQSSLRAQTHEILSAQEEARRKTSLQLQDEIAQTLLAINIWLLALKTSAKASTDKFEKEIANTQRLVRESIKKVNRGRS